MRVRSIATAVVMAGVLSAGSVWAQQPAVSDADRAAARQAALDGINAFNRQDYTTALERLQRAESIFHAPVHLRYSALSLERSNRPREALEVWRRLSQETLDASAPPVFREAVEEARRALPRLEATLGRLTIDLPNASADTSVTLDGEAIALADLAAVRIVAPGEHRVLVRRAGYRDFERTVTLAAGATERVSVSLEPNAVQVEPPPPAEPVFETRMVRSPLRTVGLIVGGVGVASLIGGAVAGVMASGEFSDLEAACPNRQCTSASDLARRDSVDTLAGASTALLIGGGVLTAAGAVLFVVGRPRAERVQVGLRGQGLDIAVHF
ncbi:MAG: PEGA domain-containing protein [Myxococcales bacterium]|nr:PEGA domain-containing protein [Myxococcales bacterium]